jgi:hypothetical protein
MLNAIFHAVTHALPVIQASRDAGMPWIQAEAIRRYMEIMTEARLAKMEREHGSR